MRALLTAKKGPNPFKNLMGKSKSYYEEACALGIIESSKFLDDYMEEVIKFAKSPKEIRCAFARFVTTDCHPNPTACFCHVAPYQTYNLLLESIDQTWTTKSRSTNPPSTYPASTSKVPSARLCSQTTSNPDPSEASTRLKSPTENTPSDAARSRSSAATPIAWRMPSGTKTAAALKSTGASWGSSNERCSVSWPSRPMIALVLFSTWTVWSIT